MMTIKEAKQILSTIEVPENMIEKATQSMLDIIHNSKASGMYRKQGGTMFEFCDKAVAWISTWTFGGDLYYHLTERGEMLYCGSNATECAKMLYKVGIAHKQYGKQFLGCK